MFGPIRLFTRLVWLGLLVLGISKAMELYHKGGEEMVRRIQQGDTSGLAGMCAGMCTQIHDALHRHADASDIEAEDFVGAHDEP